MKWFWRRIEPYVQVAITDRILKFHDAMLARGQIPKPTPDMPIESPDN